MVGHTHEEIDQVQLLQFKFSDYGLKKKNCQLFVPQTCRNHNINQQKQKCTLSFIQMFSRIAESLRRMGVVTLEQLWRVIHNSYTPSPSTVYRENIFDIKAWLRPYTATLKHHSNPHTFRFKLNDQGQVEMTYRNWAMANKKEWLPKDKSFIILEELPEGTPSLQRPDNMRCPTIEAMEGSLKHVSKRMNPEEVSWWQTFLKDEIKRRMDWEGMTDEDYREAGVAHFNLFAMQQLNPVSANIEEKDEAYIKRKKGIKELIAKKNNFPPVSRHKKNYWLKSLTLFSNITGCVAAPVRERAAVKM